MATEEGWITRQVAGALALSADVHVVTPWGAVASTSRDGVFTLHRLGRPVDPVALLRRDLLLDGLAATQPAHGASLPAGFGALLDEGMHEQWSGVGDLLASIDPNRVVIIDHRNVGALAAIDRFDAGLPVSLLALGSDAYRLACPHFTPLLARADHVLTMSRWESGAVADLRGGPEGVHRIGAPLSTNPSERSEPNGWVGEDEYVLVVTGAGRKQQHKEAELVRILRLHRPQTKVAIAHPDAFCVWQNGRSTSSWAIERHSDMSRLMAWARLTVDLRPGNLFARRSLDSLMRGTPIVVPEDSRAREHAECGGGGLWFSTPSELAWCVDALLDPATNDVFAAQGRSYAEAEYGSTDRFIVRVSEASDLPAPA